MISLRFEVADAQLDSALGRASPVVKLAVAVLWLLGLAFTLHPLPPVLGLSVPAQRDRPSEREYQEHPPAWEYGPEWQVRKVDVSGGISFRGREVQIGKAYRGERVGLRAEAVDGVWSVWFQRSPLRELDLRAGSE